MNDATLTFFIFYITFFLFFLFFPDWTRFAKKPKQTTFVYCPGCRQELVSATNRLVVDSNEGFVHYYCFQCNTVSSWDFDIPAPVLIKSYYKNPDGWLKDD